MITCPFPRHAFNTDLGETDPSYQEKEFDFFLAIVQYARLCSIMTKEVYSPSAFRSGPRHVLHMLPILEQELDRWRKSVFTGVRTLISGRPPREKDFPSPITFYQTLVLQSSYSSLLISLSRACRPTHSEFSSHKLSHVDAGTLHQIAVSGLEAARSMCLLTQQIEVESYSPNW